MQKLVLFKPSAAQNPEYFFTINIGLDVKCMGCTHSLQMIAKLENQKCSVLLWRKWSDKDMLLRLKLT